MGLDGKTAAGVRGVRGGEGERDCRRMEGRNFLSRRRSGGVRGGRVVVFISGAVGDPAG